MVEPVAFLWIVQRAGYVHPHAAVFLLKVVWEKGIRHEMEPMKAHAETPGKVVLQSHQRGCVRDHARETCGCQAPGEESAGEIARASRIGHRGIPRYRACYCAELSGGGSPGGN